RERSVVRGGGGFSGREGVAKVLRDDAGASRVEVSQGAPQRRTLRLRLTGTAILVFRASTSLQAAPASLAGRSPAWFLVARMADKVFAIYPHDSVHAPFILRRMKGGKLAVMDEYGPLICKRCRKVDERAALAQGICEEVVVRSRRPFLGSMDDHYL